MKKTGKTLITLATLAFLGLGALSFGLKQNAIGANAAAYLNNTYSWSSSGMVNAEVLTTKNLDTNWKISGSKNSASTEATYYTSGSALRVYGHKEGDGGHLLIEPTAGNIDKVLTRVEFEAYSGYTPAIKVFAGMTQAGMSEIVSQSFDTVSFKYAYTNLTGFKFFKIQNAVTGSTSQYRVKTITFDYKDEETVYDPVASLTTNFTATQFAIGEEYTFSPTILPAGANQSFVVSSLSPAIQVTGSTIKAIGVATNVVVTITTVGKNASDQTISQDVTFNTFQATTTVAEALTLTPDGKIVYLVENALVSDGYNTQYDRQIQLVDTVEPTKNILIFKYGINPLNSYRYIAGGTISFKATLGIYSGVNQFTDPIIISYSDDVETFATSILAGDAEGQCETRFAGYKTTVLGFDTAESAKLQNGTDANIVSARARYLAWAAHLGENPYTDGSSGSLAETTSNNNSLPFAIIVSILGLTVVAGLYLQRSKRKEEND